MVTSLEASATEFKTLLQVWIMGKVLIKTYKQWANGEQ
jgi:hypothetical protein